jgi:hypothetical protein
VEIALVIKTLHLHHLTEMGDFKEIRKTRLTHTEQLNSRECCFWLSAKKKIPKGKQVWDGELSTHHQPKSASIFSKGNLAINRTMRSDIRQTNLHGIWKLEGNAVKSLLRSIICEPESLIQHNPTIIESIKGLEFHSNCVRLFYSRGTLAFTSARDTWDAIPTAVNYVTQKVPNCLT